MPMRIITPLFVLVFSVSAFGCTPFTKKPRPGPDKQSVGTLSGAAMGAGAGAIIGTEVTAATGPGAVIGAGFGGIFGMLSGLGVDLIEEDQLRREDEKRRLYEIAWAQEMLSEHYARRLELHPNRDIFPADWFFEGDSTKLRPGADLLVYAIADMTRRRMPWSRMLVAAYSTSTDPASTYAKYVTEKRAEAIALRFIDSGVEPRRVLTQAVTLPDPVLIDPDDSAGRYRQAIEFIPIDY